MASVSCAAPVLAVCGSSGSGKTTLLEAAIPRLAGRGLAVAVVKHHAHAVDLDPRGKDSDRLFRAGAEVVVVGPDELLWRRHAPGASLLAILAELGPRHDLVLVEGGKETSLPKLWLLGPGDEAPPEGVGDVERVLGRDEDRVEATVAWAVERVEDAWRRRPLWGGLLVGGASSRMGSPKQLLELGGRTFAERVTAALRGTVEEVVALGAGPLPEPLAGLPRLPDVPGTGGPLAGILAALRWRPEAAWVIAGCDQPLATGEAVRWLAGQRRPGRWAVLPRLAADAVEPLLAVYEPQARPPLEMLALAREPAPSAFARHPRAASPEPPAHLHRCWCSIDTADEYGALRDRPVGDERG